MIEWFIGAISLAALGLAIVAVILAAKNADKVNKFEWRKVDERSFKILRQDSEMSFNFSHTALKNHALLINALIRYLEIEFVPASEKESHFIKKAKK